MKKNFSLILALVTAAALCAALWGNAVLAEPGSCSAGYTVDFSYQGAAYSVRGQSCCALESIFYRLGIDGDVQNARLDLASGEDIEGALALTREAGGWYLTSEVPFDSTYTLTAEVDGRNVSVRVTDAAAEGANTSFLKRSTRIQVTLVWDDSGNQDGARPSDVTVGLYPRGESGQVSPQITLKRQDDENVWSGSFYAPIQDESGNPVPYDVKVVQVRDRDGKEIKAVNNGFNTGFRNAYTAVWSGSPEEGYTVTCSYEPEKTSFTVYKYWRDDYNRDGIRPDSAAVQLLADGEACGEEAVIRGEKTAMYWAFTFDDLFRYSGGKEIVYSAVETGVEGLAWKDGPAAGWYAGNTLVYTAWNNRETRLVDGRQEIVDQHDPETVTIVAGKTWADSGNADGVRPTSVTFTLKADGKPVPENDGYLTVTMDGVADTGLQNRDHGETAPWRASFPDLYRYRNGGQPIVYTVDETAMKTGSVHWSKAAGSSSWTSVLSRNPYVSSGTASAANHYMIVGTYQPAPVKAAVSIVWDDDDNAAGKRPERLEASLLADGEVIAVIPMSGENGWTAVQNDVRPFINEKKVEYTWQIEKARNYTEPEGSRTVAALDSSGTVRTTVTCRYEPDTVQPVVSVVWNDQDAPKGSRPESVTIRLLADGEPMREAAVGEAENWAFDFGELSRWDGEDRKIVYTVEQNPLTVYKTDVTGDAEQGFVIANAYYSASGNVRLSAVKLVSGEEPTEFDERFSFELYVAEVDEANLKLLGVSEYPMAMVNNSGSSVRFPEISYDVSEAGRTYWFLVSEVIPEGRLNYDYDFTRFVAGVTLNDNGDGTLSTDTDWYQVDEASRTLTAIGEGAVFNNLRGDPAALSVTMTVDGNKTTRHFDMSLTLKDENGAALTGEYPYTIQDADGNLVEEGTFNLDDGTITPRGADGSLSFRLADGEMIIINYLPTGSSFTAKAKTTKAYVTSTVDNGETNMVSGEIVDGGAHVDFVNKAVTTEFQVTKKWENGEDPGWSIVLVLGTVDNGEFIPVIDQNAYPYDNKKNRNVYFYHDLPMYDDQDHIITYAVKERPIDGYDMIRYINKDSNASSYALNKGTIVNSKAATFEIRKQWIGLEEGEVPPPITLRLLKLVDPETGRTEEVWSEKYDTKKATWSRKFQVTQGEIYYMEEVDPPAGFAVSYQNSENSPLQHVAENGGLIINTRVPKTGDDDPVGLWTAMFLTGLTGLAVLAVLYGRKKRES